MGWAIEYAQWHGWKAAHFRPCRTAKGWRTAVQGDPGFLDVVFARNGDVIIAEFKSEDGELTPEQEQWFQHIEAGHTEVYVWRPSDRAFIEERLR